MDGHKLMDGDSLRIHAGLVLKDRYEILEEIGSGGFATVYRGRDLSLGREVAVKVLKSASPDQLARFQREAMLLAQLSHRNIITVFAFDQLEDSTQFIVMELLPGRSLRGLLNEKDKLDYGTLRELLQQTCAALSYAHDLGIVHRDLSPANIFLIPAEDRFTVKILDFGLSRIYAGEAGVMQTLTETGMIMGNPHYMSPELALGQCVDPRTDIYALGCILYECISGRAPFDADSPTGLIYMQLHNSPPEPVIVWPGEEERAELVKLLILRCLQKNADRRFQNAEQVIQSLNETARTFQSKEELSGWSGKPQIRGGSKMNHPLIISSSAILLFICLCFCYEPFLCLILGATLPIMALPADMELSLARKLSAWQKNAAAVSVLTHAEQYCSSRNDNEKLVECCLLESRLLMKEGNRSQLMSSVERLIEILRRSANSAQKDAQLLLLWQLIMDTSARGLLDFKDICRIEVVVFDEMLSSKLRDRTNLSRCFDTVLKAKEQLELLDRDGVKSCVEAVIRYLNTFSGGLSFLEQERLELLTQVCASKHLIAEFDRLFEARIFASKHSGEDTGFVKATFGRELMARDPEKAMKVCREAERDSTNPKVIGRALNMQGRLYLAQKSYVQALSCFDRAIESFDVQGTFSIPTNDTYNEKITTLFMMGRKESAVALSRSRARELWASMEPNALMSVYSSALGGLSEHQRAHLESFQRIYADFLRTLIQTDQKAMAVQQIKKFICECRAEHWLLDSYLVDMLKWIKKDAALPDDLRQAAEELARQAKECRAGSP